MNEFKQIKSLYKKHTHYHRNIFLISGILIVSISIFVAVDVVRVNPLIFYAVGVGIVTFYALFNRVESSNYDQLKKFLKDYQPDILDDKEFLFFLDYQLSNHLNRKSEVWFQELNDSSELKKNRAARALEKCIRELDGYYQFLQRYASHKNRKEISFQNYRILLNQRRYGDSMGGKEQ